MDWFIDAFTNPILVVPIIAWFTAQMLKFIINFCINREFSVRRLTGDGGMPSGHAATVTALASMCGLLEGFSSPIFAVAMIFAVIVMHDAMGVRRETGKQAQTILNLTKALNEKIDEEEEKVKTEKLKLMVGHTFVEVFVGALLGFAVAMIAYFIVA